jgi:hypothetical protein
MQPTLLHTHSEVVVLCAYLHSLGAHKWIFGVSNSSWGGGPVSFGSSRLLGVPSSEPQVGTPKNL